MANKEDANVHRVSSKHNNYFFLLQNTIFPTIFGVALKIVAYL